MTVAIFEGFVGFPYLALGIIAGVLSFCAFYPYIYNVIFGQTRPDRATWLVWSVLGAVSLAGQLYEGATASMLFVSVQVSGTILVSLLSIWRGHGAFFHPRNLGMYACAGVGLVLWYQTETALYAILISIVISMLGGFATIAKAYRAPQSECRYSWLTLLTAAICAVFSVQGFDPVLLAYPIYLLVLYTAVVMGMYLGRNRAARTIPFKSYRVLATPSASAST